LIFGEAVHILATLLLVEVDMQRERVTEDIYVFTSDLYAQVTAGLVITTEGAVLIDTLVFPEETLLIKRFAENRLGTVIRYVINTHYHADHTTGTCFFPGIEVIAHQRCRELLDQRGRESLERMKATSPEMQDVELVLPTMVFDSGIFRLDVGGKTFEMWHSPGHSPDSIVCLVRDDRVLFAADTLMPLPYFVDGSFDDLLASLQGLLGENYESVVQGHGEVILRGEIEEKIVGDIEYLRRLRQAVDAALASPSPDTALNAITAERCGKSRILLNGVVEQLHRQNVIALASQRRELAQS
jgi:glyoxylase-like metal-dependent hydrolase (beta-lactamase superfamily II)